MSCETYCRLGRNLSGRDQCYLYSIHHLIINATFYDVHLHKFGRAPLDFSAF